jgi:hypothetical protein
MNQKHSRSSRSLVCNDVVAKKAHRVEHATQASTVRPKKTRVRTFDDVHIPKKKRPEVQEKAAAFVKKTARPQPNIQISEPQKTHTREPLKLQTAEKSDPKAQDPYLVTLSLDIFVIVLLGYIGFISRALFVALAIYLIAIIYFKISLKRLLVSALICLILIPVLQLMGRSVLEKSYIACFVYFIFIAIFKITYPHLENILKAKHTS